ncbi:amidohydrolase family protein [Streptomyces sp. NPDC048644]|uniref:amidohydrolase family protein n=1 Tax=Streptomyces sp. NPDC048644 TaxID=3365582 RepID=UPI003719F96F
MTVVDVHAHVFPSISRQESRILDAEAGPWLREDSGGAGMMSGTTEYRPVGAELWNPRLRLEQMDRQGVNIQVVSSTPLMSGYCADTARAAQWCALANDRILELCATGPDRLVPLCQVPLQDTEAACAEVTDDRARPLRTVPPGAAKRRSPRLRRRPLQLLRYTAATAARYGSTPLDPRRGGRRGRPAARKT